VFPPDQAPTFDQAASGGNTLTTSDYTRADITYLDADGRVTNTASPGGHLTTTGYDSFGNVTRQLSAANRERALDPSYNNGDSVITASQLDERNVYDATGMQLLWTVGPRHEIAVPQTGGTYTTTNARAVNINTYDTSGYNLITETLTGALPSNSGVDPGTTTKTALVAALVDTRLSTSSYDPTLLTPQTSSTDPSGLNLVTSTVSDTALGTVTSDTTPGGVGTTNTPRTTVSLYYRAGTGSGDSQCDSKPQWAGMVCRTGPGGQPATDANHPSIPSTYTTSYDLYNQPAVVVEKVPGGSALRTTNTAYREGRPYSVAVTGPGQAIPITHPVYDQVTGLQLETQTVTLAGNGDVATVLNHTIVTYDAAGQQTSYTDTDGNYTSTGYDLLGRPATTNDGKGTRTYTYDTSTEPRGMITKITDSQGKGSTAGDFTGTYDADGELTRQTMPNGVQADTVLDETGAPTSLTYTNTNPACIATDCTLFADTLTRTINGQVATHDGLSSQAYRYDNAGRLTEVDDTYAGTCTSRSYGFDNTSAGKNTNRTSLTVYDPALNGTCQRTTPNTTLGRTWTYDTADRTTTGYVYDTLGRTTTVPAADTTHPTGGTLTATYHANDLVRTLTHNGRTTTYTLDTDNQRIRSWTDNNGTTTNHLNHYTDSSDTPAWTAENTGVNTDYTRNISGFTGLSATYTSTSGGTITYNLANLHGDLIATTATDGTLTTGDTDTDEYGYPRNPANTGTLRYSWLGTEQRAADTPTGITLMGARLYNPTTGRFLTVDPVRGGSCNNYDYVCADPVRMVDLDGKIPTPNKAERKRGKDHPWEFSVWLIYSKWAWNTAKDTYKKSGDRNAFRHCIWQAVLTWRLGLQSAQAWADAHETSTGKSKQAQRDHKADMWNNAVGQYVGKNIHTWLLFTAQGKAVEQCKCNMTGAGGWRLDRNGS
jgi:RHS repeat-associated protein